MFRSIFGITKLKKVARVIEKKLAAYSVAIRLVFEGEDLRGEIRPMSRICSAIDRAKNRAFILSHSSLSCPIAKFVLRGKERRRLLKKYSKRSL